MKTIRFGIVSCGLMGREFASAASRWCHLLDMPAQPEVVAVCNRSPGPFAWFKQHFPRIRQFTDNYQELVDNPDVEAVYVAVPHHLHQEIYCAVIRAGKHLMGEKPFGIDLPANQSIVACARDHPDVTVRCASQFAFFPACQRIGDMFERRAFGRILEVNTGFLHSSDLDPNKPINWKRMARLNGAYGCMGDLGMHICHLPFRAGLRPINVRAVLSDIVQQRPDGAGNMVSCDTWDNAVLLCETLDPESGHSFPWTLKTMRIAPGERNTWYIEVLGTKASVRYSIRDPRRLELLEYRGGEQAWRHVQTGYEPAFRTVTGPIFEFGFTDAILQMWAAFLYELVNGRASKRFAACATPEEATLSHRLFTAALASQKEGRVVAIE